MSPDETTAMANGIIRNAVAPIIGPDHVAVLVIYPRSGKGYFCAACTAGRALIVLILAAAVVNFRGDEPETNPKESEP